MGRDRMRQQRFEEIAEVTVDDHKKIVLSKRVGHDDHYTISSKTLTTVDGKDMWVYLAGGLHLNGNDVVSAFRRAVDYMDDVINGKQHEVDQVGDWEDSENWSPSEIL